MVTNVTKLLSTDNNEDVLALACDELCANQKVVKTLRHKTGPSSEVEDMELVKDAKEYDTFLFQFKSLITRFVY